MVIYKYHVWFIRTKNSHVLNLFQEPLILYHFVSLSLLGVLLQNVFTNYFQIIWHETIIFYNVIGFAEFCITALLILWKMLKNAINVFSCNSILHVTQIMVKPCKVSWSKALLKFGKIHNNNPWQKGTLTQKLLCEFSRISRPIFDHLFTAGSA